MKLTFSEVITTNMQIWNDFSTVRNILPHHEKKTPILAVPWFYMALIAFLELSTLFHAALHAPWTFFPLVRKVLAALTSEGSRVFTLQWAVTLVYIASSSMLRVLISHQVWRQSIQVDDHHLCPGMPLIPIYDVYTSDDYVGAFPVRLQLGWFSSLPGRAVQPHSVAFLKRAELDSWF